VTYGLAVEEWRCGAGAAGCAEGSPRGEAVVSAENCCNCQQDCCANLQGMTANDSVAWQCHPGCGWGPVASSCCFTARPLHARSTNTSGASFSDAAMRMNPRDVRSSRTTTPTCDWAPYETADLQMEFKMLDPYYRRGSQAGFPPPCSVSALIPPHSPPHNNKTEHDIKTEETLRVRLTPAGLRPRGRLPVPHVGGGNYSVGFKLPVRGESTLLYVLSHTTPHTNLHINKSTDV
jgi:hypothetical protein